MYIHFFLFSHLLTACSTNDESNNDTQNDSTTDPNKNITDEENFVPTIAISDCGYGDYNWLSTEGMGEIIDNRDDDTLSIPAATISMLLSNFGLENVLTPTYDVQTYQIRYRSQNRGKEIETTGLVSVPVGFNDDDQKPPLLLWTHPTTGFSDTCAPSGQGLEGAAFPMLFASTGMVVVAPDYFGMNGWGDASDMTHPYGVAEPTAIASLDSLRAVMNLTEIRDIPVPDTEKLVIWGASEGGFAALWSDRYLPHYAPEFKPIAIVATVPPTDMKALATYGVQNFSDTTAGVAAVQLMGRKWYGADADLDSELLYEGLLDPFWEGIEEACEDFGQYLQVSSLDDVFVEDYAISVANEDWEDVQPWSCFLEESTLAESKIPYASNAPVFILTGEEDDLVIADTVKNSIPQLCDLGYQIEYHQCLNLDHVDAALDTLPMQLRWIEERIAGISIESYCSNTDMETCQTYE